MPGYNFNLGKTKSAYDNDIFNVPQLPTSTTPDALYQDRFARQHQPKTCHMCMSLNCNILSNYWLFCKKRMGVPQMANGRLECTCGNIYIYIYIYIIYLYIHLRIYWLWIIIFLVWYFARHLSDSHKILMAFPQHGQEIDNVVYRFIFLD